MKNTWYIGQITSSFIARMERILWLYSLPQNTQYPVVCFDERPCFLIGEVIALLNPQPPTPNLRGSPESIMPTPKTAPAAYWPPSNRPLENG